VSKIGDGLEAGLQAGSLATRLMGPNAGRNAQCCLPIIVSAGHSNLGVAGLGPNKRPGAWEVLEATRLKRKGIPAVIRSDMAHIDPAPSACSNWHWLSHA
jgi:hypothetical protein